VAASKNCTPSVGTKENPSTSRRVHLAGGAAAALSLILSPSLPSFFSGASEGRAEAAVASASRQLQPLGAYQAQLKEAQGQLDVIGANLRSMAAASNDDTSDAGPARSDRYVYGKLQLDLHRGQLGRFWAIARGADQYVEAAVPGERGSLAREQVIMAAIRRTPIHTCEYSHCCCYRRTWLSPLLLLLMLSRPLFLLPLLPPSPFST
jgi:hypothetical protein